MDPKKVVEILEGTMHPTLRKEAESKLDEMHKISGFAPLLLQIVMSDEIPMAVRQSGAIYLKNMCVKWWKRDPDEEGSTDVFFIHENDKVVIRENIVEAIIHAPDVIRSQMSVTVFQIIREDFPERWPGIIDKIGNYLGSDPNTWMGALQTLYQLVKKYEYKKKEERGPILEAMKIFLPGLGQLFQHALNDGSAQSVLIQKMCLKVIYALIQYSLPLKLFNEATLDIWMKYIQIVIEQTPPEETLQVDELERPDLPWWKCKKWALHILTRVFERYGSPGTVSQEYNQFSEFFLRRYAVGATHVLLKVLDDYSKKVYISPRILQQTMQFLEQGVSHSQTWKVMKGVYDQILKDVLFPLMCFSDKDQELWEDDPLEFVRERFDFKEDFYSPSSAAQCFLQSACTKRKQVVQKTMGLCHKVLVSSQTKNEPRRKEGALHVIGSLSSTLRKRKIYKTQLENMLITHAVPEYKSKLGFMRARAAWITQHFSRITFKNDSNVYAVADGIRKLLIEDPELPVRVEAAFALQTFLVQNEKAEKRCESSVNVIIQSLLQLVHETENDELTSVVHKIICLYCEQVIPYAVDITQSLVMTFFKLLTDENGQINGSANDDDDETADNRAVAAMGVLNTIETVLDAMEEQRDITVQLESIVVPVVAHVLKNRIMDFYEEILSLMYSLTCQAISPQMWEALPLIKNVFDDDGFDFFSEMMPVLHNFVTIDTNVFLSNTNNMEVVYEMCKKVLEEEESEDAEGHAVKLLEVIILQCRGKIDQCIPLFVQLALSRLTKEVKSSELRTMCLQVVIAAIYYNPPMLFQTLESMQFPNTTETVTEQFFRQWLKDADCFLGIHDRRISILGLCTVIDSPEKPAIISELAADILPSLILMLQGLTQAYRSRGDDNSSNSSNSDDEDESDHEREELESSEDEVDEESAEYLEMLEKNSSNGFDGASDDEDDGETQLEIYSSSFDDEDNQGSEYFIFKQVLKRLEQTNSAWYNQLVSGLTDDQRKNLQEVFTTADQRQAEAESKKIEKTGGYQFNTTNVPTSFNFAASGPPAAFSP